MAEPLRIRFATDVDGAKSAVASLAASIATNAVSMGNATKSVNDNLKMLGQTLESSPLKATNFVTQLRTAGQAAVGAVVGLAAISVALKAMGSALDEVTGQLDRYVEIGGRAKDLDLGTSFLQAFRDQAKDLKLEVSDLESSLDHFRNATKVSADTGQSAIRSRIADIFQTGYTGSFNSPVIKLFDNAKSDEDRLRAVLQGMRELRDVGNDIAMLDLAEKAFGATKLTDGLRSGKIDLDAFVSKLDEVKIPPEAIQRAEELKDRLNDAYREIEDNLKVSIISLEPAASAVLNVWVKIVETIAAGTKALADFSKAQPTTPFAANPFSVDLQRAAELIGRFTASGRPIASSDSPGSSAELARARSQSVPNFNDPSTFPSGERAARAVPYYDQPGYVSGEGRKPSGPLLDPNDAAPLPPRRPLGLFTGSNDKRGSAAPTDPEGLDAIERYIVQMEKAGATAKVELETINSSNVERAKGIALANLDAAAKNAGRAATDEERDAILRQAEATAKLRDQTMDARQAQQELAEAMRTFGQLGADAFADMLLEARSFDDVLKNVTKTLARYAIQAAFTGQGPLAGLLGLSSPASSGPNAIGGVLGLLGLGGGGGSGADVTQWHAAGGLVRGIGSGTSDSIPARLSNGEFVVRAAAVPANIDVLRAINARGYADGGLVGRMKGSGASGSASVVIGDTYVDARGMDPTQLRAELELHRRAQRREITALADAVVRDRGNNWR